MLDSCRALESEGHKVTYLPVQSDGLIDLQVRKYMFVLSVVKMQIYQFLEPLGHRKFEFLPDNKSK